MHFLQLIPQLFYADILIGKDLFVDGLGFVVIHDSGETDPFLILSRDGVTVHLFQQAAAAARHRPELRIDTDDIEAAYMEVRARRPDLLHPRLNQIKAQPWGLKEFALRDETGVCVIVQQH